MKTSLRTLLALIALTIASQSFATIYTVTVSNYQFTPANVNAQVGDTIQWVWVNGSHTTTSGSIPAGAAPWDADIEEDEPGFSYVITEAGTYNYVCTPHAPEMAGTITATGNTSVGTAPQAGSMTLYPSPATNTLYLSADKAGSTTANIVITDLTGRMVLQQAADISKGASINTSLLPAGRYFLRAQTGAELFTGSFIIVR